ncbi:MAG: DUF5103 domain-containing protein [Bacteroidales bacterium]
MHKKFKNIAIISFILLFCYFTNNTYGAKNVQEQSKNKLEFVNSPDIKSVKLHKLGWELSEAALELRSNDKLLISFDDISDNPKSYSYTIAHCDSEWIPSSLFFNDFADGFEINEIRDYSYSSGTIFDFMHCRLEIPNDDIKLKISGNYIIKIFNTYEPEEILIQRKFIVYESLVGISSKIRQPSAGLQRQSGQQMELKVNTSEIRVSDPFSEVKTVVCQNYLFQGCKKDVKPTYIRDNELDYSHPDALIFEGGNEFRIFDLKNIRYVSQGIKSIDFHGGVFHAQLTPDKSRRREGYSSQSDLNGKFVISLERSNQSQTEADYVWVYFSLDTPMQLDEGSDVYLYGELTGWQLSPENRMEYIPERKAYEKRLLLKQGVYNYRYVLANEQTGNVDVSHFEGSFYDTENTYMVLVYYKPIGARYERIVGYERISTIK